MKRPSVREENVTSVAQVNQTVVHNNSHIRQLFCVLFILFSSIWLLYTGVKFRLQNQESSFPQAEIQHGDMAYAATTSAQFVIKEATRSAGLVIFLHGLGDNGNGWCQAFDGMKQKNIRYIFPNAKVMPVSLNMGLEMPSWFDIVSLNMEGKEDEKGIKEAAERVRNIMKEEQEKLQLRSDQIILGGFSMGGALALYTGLTHSEKLGGMIALSSWLPLRENFFKKVDGVSLCQQLCPIFQGHGKADFMVKEKFGSQTNAILAKAREGTDATTVYKTYKELQHSSCDEELEDVKKFIQNLIPEN